MSDIAFLLLIFLMLSSIINLKKGPNITIPKAKKISRPKSVQKYEISIDKNGNFFLEGKYVTTKEITDIFYKRAMLYPDMYVQLSADEETEYQAVNSVVKALQEARSYRILFVCKKKKEWEAKTLKLWLKDNLFKICVAFSAVIQVLIILIINFESRSGDLDKKFIPMTIRPIEELIPKKKVRIVKKIKEVKKEEIPDKEKPEESPKETKTVTQTVTRSTRGTYMSYVRVDEIPRPKSSLKPPYPEAAKSAGVEGEVILELYIDEQGIVRKVKLIKGIGFGCDKAAIRKVKATRFYPAKMGNKPVAVRMRQIIEFKFTN